jgi:hypothetical protein
MRFFISVLLTVLSLSNIAFSAAKKPKNVIELTPQELPSNQQEPVQAAPIIEAKPVNEFDDIASYLAGYGDAPEDHKLAMDALWQHYETKNLKAFQDWQKQEISSSDINASCSVFYPFSGPDVLHMLTLFPSCKKYIMIGLEAPGKLEHLTKEKIHLARLRQGISSLLNRSFFVTREMWDDFAIERNGVVTPILTLLKRMNYNIVNVERMYLSNNGVLSDNAKVGNGIKITIKAANNDYEQEIYYFKKILTGNAHGVNELLNASDFLITYLKAAQYALFDPRFSLIRSSIVEKSSMVLQDDSGLTFRYLNNKQWQMTLYGNYESPYGAEFAGYMQKDLKKSYQTLNLKPLPFSLGYGYKKINSMMIKALKVKKHHVEKPAALAMPKEASEEQVKDVEETPNEPKLEDAQDNSTNTTSAADEAVSKIPGMAIKH